MADVKNVLECIAFLKAVAVTVKECLGDDGKVNFLDIPKLAKLWAPARDAIEGIDQALAELKDIDSAEVATLLVALVDLGKEWAGVFTKAKLAA